MMTTDMQREFQILERVSEALKELPYKEQEELVWMLELGAVIRQQALQERNGGL